MARLEHKTELLAPAGTIECALAAYDNGADAVYGGLGKFNARERSENFTVPQLAKIIDFAHSKDKKFYLTLNTLVKDSELPELADMLVEVAKMSPDAVIVQDIGLLRILREYFGQLEIHASTQMGFHNSAGIAMAEKMGVKRVILERQLTFDELAAIRKKSRIELEVFVHGALCCSLSGQCLFSSWLGGWSGNRGRCKQPCRRRYFSPRHGNGFFFSPQDLYMLEDISTLKTLGINSLKIEGRLRKSDYVANTVKAYRLILDAEDAKQAADRLGEARRILSSSPGRKWSKGFSSAGSAATLIDASSTGAVGQLCGKVTGIEANGFYFRAAKRIKLGDRLRLQSRSGDDGNAFTLTKMRTGNHEVAACRSGNEVFVFYDREIVPDALVFKIGESSADYASQAAALPQPRKVLAFKLKVDRSGFSAEACGVEWHYNIDLEAAKQHALTANQLHDEFSAVFSNKLRFVCTDASVDGEYFLPQSILKKVKKDFRDHFEAKVDDSLLYADILEAAARLRESLKTPEKQNNFSAEELQPALLLRPNGEKPGKKARQIIARSIFEYDRNTTEVLLPSFCAEQYLETLEKRIAEAWKNSIRRFRITSLYGFELMKKYPQAIVSVSFPLGICNRFSIEEMKESGVSRLMAHVELERAEIERLIAHSDIVLETYRYGRIPLLATRARLPLTGHVKDARGNEFIIREDKAAGLFLLYGAEVVSIPRIPGSADFYDLYNAFWHEKNCSSFNFDHPLA